MMSGAPQSIGRWAAVHVPTVVWCGPGTNRLIADVFAAARGEIGSAMMPVQ